MKNVYKIIFLSLIFASGNIQAGIYDYLKGGVFLACRIGSYLCWPIFKHDLIAAKESTQKKWDRRFYELNTYVKANDINLDARFTRLNKHNDQLGSKLAGLNSDLDQHRIITYDKIRQTKQNLNNSRFNISNRIRQISQEQRQSTDFLNQVTEKLRKNETEVRKIQDYLAEQARFDEQVNSQHQKDLEQLHLKEKHAEKKYSKIIEQSNQLDNRTTAINTQLNELSTQTSSLKSVADNLNKKFLEQTEFIDKTQEELRKISILVHGLAKKNDILEKTFRDIQERLNNCSNKRNQSYDVSKQTFFNAEEKSSWLD